MIMGMVEIFKTNVSELSEAEKVIALLQLHFPSYTINFDLHDCDKILRVKGESILINEIEQLVSNTGFQCYVLE